MTTPDLNQLTISGRVDRKPQLQEHEERGTVCRFVLTHTVELPDSERFSAEIQFYNVSIYGPLGESFAALYRPGQRLIIEGRLDCCHVARLRTRLTAAGARDVLVNTWGHGWALTRPH